MGCSPLARSLPHYWGKANITTARSLVVGFLCIFDPWFYAGMSLMSEHELAEWAEDFEAFCSRFTSLFSRREGRRTFASYLRGLLSSVGRKNAWQLAEKLGMRLPDAIQRLMYRDYSA